MRYPSTMLIAAVVFFVLGGALVVPWTPPSRRATIGPEGRTMRPRTEAETRADRLKDLRLNWPAYGCFAVGTFSLGWFGVAAFTRGRRHDEAA